MEEYNGSALPFLMQRRVCANLRLASLPLFVCELAFEPSGMGGQSLFMHVKTILPMTDGWTVKKGKKIRKIPLTKTNTLVIIVNAAKRCGNFISFMNSEKYSRGRRGAPAKGVGRATGARVQ
ncbi:hypothetical protein, partial [Catenibacillus scindens]|uniref:hypothetical protein n=1 Tax=Catenibacillus scindens TaxID=673271 RepID=UPI0032095DE3